MAGEHAEFDLLIAVTGHSGAHLQLGKFRQAEFFAVIGGKVAGRLAGDVRFYPAVDEVPGGGYRFFRKMADYTLQPGRQLYHLKVRTTDAEETLSALGGAFTNAVTGRSVAPKVIRSAALERGQTSVAGQSMHVWDLSKRDSRITTLGPGRVVLRDDLILNEADTLRVEAGTDLLLGPGVSIASKGPVHFEGSADLSIQVQRLDPKHPWGAIVVHGAATRSSTIRHTRFSGGSQDELFNVAYTGMVSIHGSDDIHIENSVFENNLLSDDLLHIVYGTALLSSLDMRDCFADCIDFDYVDSRITALSIERAGNDGLDLMTSEVHLNQLAIDGVGDKGISIGEKSRVVVRGAEIRHALTGIAVKDASSLHLHDVVLERNELAIDVFSKNWRYGGPGLVEMVGTQFSQNQIDIGVEEGGTVVARQLLPARIYGDGEVVSIGVGQ